VPVPSITLKYVVLQVNDAAVMIRLFIYGSARGTALLCTDYRTDWRRRGERIGVPPL
jgi:hypothetical protein